MVAPIQRLDQGADLRRHILLQGFHFLFAEAHFPGQHPRQAEDDIQIRLLLEAVLRRGGAKGGYIALQQIRVELSAGAKTAIDGQGNFQVAAQHFFLEQPAQAHLQGLSARRHAHVQVEETVIDALEREIPGEQIVDATAGSGEAGH
jgi:hypothetical protein